MESKRVWLVVRLGKVTTSIHSICYAGSRSTVFIKEAGYELGFDGRSHLKRDLRRKLLKLEIHFKTNKGSLLDAVKRESSS